MIHLATRRCSFLSPRSDVFGIAHAASDLTIGNKPANDHPDTLQWGPVGSVGSLRAPRAAINAAAGQTQPKCASSFRFKYRFEPFNGVQVLVDQLIDNVSRALNPLHPTDNLSYGEN